MDPSHPPTVHPQRSLGLAPLSYPASSELFPIRKLNENQDLFLTFGLSSGKMQNWCGMYSKQHVC